MTLLKSYGESKRQYRVSVLVDYFIANGIRGMECKKNCSAIGRETKFQLVPRESRISNRFSRQTDIKAPAIERYARSENCLI